MIKYGSKRIKDIGLESLELYRQLIWFMTYNLSVQTDATLLASNSQHCWMSHFASVCTPCCMLLRVVGSCCAKFETDQTFRNNSQHCWQCCVRLHVRNLKPRANGRITVGQQLATFRMLHVSSVCTPCCMLQLVFGSCCPKFETGQTLIYLQTGRNNSQRCWELLRPFARYLR